MFGFVKQVFIELLCFSKFLSSIANIPDHVNCISLIDQPSMTQPTLISLNPNEYIEELRYYPLAVNLDRCMGSCGTLNNLFNKVCVPNKIEDLILSVFNIITGINELKILTEYISSGCICKFDGRKCNSNQKWNKDKCRYEWKNLSEHDACKKEYIWKPSTCIFENGEYLATSIDNLVITCYEIVNAPDSVSKNHSANIISAVLTNFHKKVKYKMDCYILQTVLLMIIWLFTLAIICYHYAKHNIAEN